MKESWEKGSYTVEASLLMAILIPLLTGIIYLGFYLHNQCFLRGAAYEIAAIGVLHDRPEEAFTLMEERKDEILAGYLLQSGDISAKIEAGEEQVFVGLEGTMKIPGMVLGLFGKEELPLEARVSLKRQDASRRVIRLYKVKAWKGE